MFKQNNLVSSATKLLILEKFIQDYERCMDNFFNQKRDVDVTFDDFANLMYGVGFTKIPYDSKFNEEFGTFEPKKIKKKVKYERNYGSYGKGYDSGEESLDVRTTKYRRRKEFEFLSDAWKLLIGPSCLVNSSKDKVNSNQLLIFCLSVLGLYKGEGAPESPERELLSPSTVPRDLSDINILSLDTKDTKESNVNTKSILSKTPKPPSLRDKDVKVTSIRLDSNISNNSSKLMNNRKQTTKSQRSQQSHSTRAKKVKVLIKAVLPEFDLSRYSYHVSTVKNINSAFHQLYVNRVDYLIDLKKKLDEDHKRSKSVTKDTSTSFSFSLGNKSCLSAQHWREKKFNVIKEDYKSEDEGDDRKLKIYEVYQYLEKKKERYIK